jgi:outer membrane lipopolysaccharide assembly protein LptE/RlpB
MRIEFRWWRSCPSFAGRLFRRFQGGLLLLGLFVALQACGYRFAGGGSLPAGIRHLYIPTMENRSAETGIETTVTNALAEEAGRRQIEVTASAETADGVLIGEISRIATTTVSRSGANTAAERRVEIQVRLRLEDTAARELKRIDTVEADRVYDVIDGDEAATEANRKVALEEASRDLAESVYQRLTNDF